MRLCEVMTRHVAAIQPFTRGEKARALMKQHHCRHLPVLDRGHLIGIVSERDIHVPRLARQRREIAWIDEVPVEWIMSSPVIVLPPDAAVSEAAKIMRDRKISCIPIVQEGRVLGMVTTADLLNLLDPASGALLYPPHPHRVTGDPASHFDG